MQYASKVSASRRGLNSHEAAKPRTASQLSSQGKNPALRDLENLKTEIIAVSLSGHTGLGEQLTINDREPPCHIEPVNCVGSSGFQSVRRAAAAKVRSGLVGLQQRRLEYVPCIGPQRGAGGYRCWRTGVTRPWQAQWYRLPCAALPNPSLKRSANGRPPGPVWRYAVHFRQPGPGVLPSSPA